ncbi:MAG: NAD(P)/FAD-dependent oxidoreductase [Anaerolineae bacterium]|nr:NAD(P)/FAD-dependent oxidoreductase [Anaerolineae bacterium]
MPANIIADYEVIIAGAGPAGLATGLHLMRRAPGLAGRTLILEKARHPRPKLCAGGLLPDVFNALEVLDLDVNEVPHVRTNWANFVYQERGFRMHAIDRDFAFYVIRRNEFDAWLATKARERGLEIHEETAVTGMHVAADGVTVETARGVYRAKAVVGADGALSIVRRHVMPREPTRVARTLEVVVPPRTGEAPPHPADEATFEFCEIPGGIQGYVWDFPTQVNGEPMRCWGIYDSRIDTGASRGNLPEALARVMARHGYGPDDYTLESHPVRWFNPRAAFSAPRLLLVGDAAGVDVIFGEGLSPAFGYGALAAGALIDAFAAGDFTFADYGDRVRQSSLGRALQWRVDAARRIYTLRRPQLQRLLWRRMGFLMRPFVNTFLINWTKRFPWG